MDMGMGKVYIVGAGPGAPDLITLRGLELLKRAHTVVYAGSLVNPELLKFCPEGCRLVNSHGKRLKELVDIMAMDALSGKTVVRLASGDPSLYGSLKEMAEELGKRDVEVEVVPGVSSLFAGAATLKEEFTVPEGPQSLVITRLPGRTPVRPQEALERFAATGASIAVFLSVDKAHIIREKALKAGLPPDTPVAIVHRASWKEERVIETTLERLAPPEGIKGTAIVYILPGRRLKGKRSYLYGQKSREDSFVKDSTPITLIAAGRLPQSSELAEEIIRHFPKASLLEGPPSRAIREAWDKGAPIVFLGPVGVAVRLAAPLLKDKREDPPLLCVDIAGSFVVVVSGGHHGGNALARKLASAIGAVPVITTGTEAVGVPSLEELAMERGFHIEGGTTKRFNSLSIRGEEILVVGMGWRKGLKEEEMEKALQTIRTKVEEERIAAFAVPWIKAEEAKRLLLPKIERQSALLVIPEELMRENPGPTPSRAEDKLGIPGVAEPCALSVHPEAKLIIKKQAVGNVTFAVAGLRCSG